MSGRQSLGLASVTGGLFLLYVSVRQVVGDGGLPLIPFILGLVLITKGWEWLDVEDRIVELWEARRSLVITLAVGAVVIVGAIVLVARQQADREPYPSGARGDFMADCTVGQADWAELCDCEYDYFEANVDFERYREIAGLSADAGSETDEVQSAARHCIVEEDVELPKKLREQIDGAT